MSHPSSAHVSTTRRWWLWGFVTLSVAMVGVIGWHLWRKKADQSGFVYHRLGAPILVRERVFGRERLRTWDWQQNRWIDLGPIDRDVYSMESFNQDRSLAYMDGDSLVIIELSSPPKRVTIDLKPVARCVWGDVVGIARNSRYAVLQNINDRASSDGSRLVHALRVVDLQTLTLVDERFGESFYITTDGENQFASQRRNVKPPHYGNEPLDGMWELTEEGHWQSIASSPGLEMSHARYLAVTQQPDGSWCVIGHDKVSTVSTPVSEVSLLANRRDGKVSLVRMLFDGHFYQLDRESSALTRLESSLVLWSNDRPVIRWGGVTAYTSDGKAILAIDVNGAVIAIDATTGKTIAINREYSVNTMEYLFATIAALVFGSAWALLAWRTKNIGAWIGACTASLVFCELAAAERLLVCRNYDSQFHHVVAACCAVALVAIVTGTTIIVGWLWAWADFAMLKRWLLGTIVVISITIPAAMGLSFWQTDFIASFSDFGLIGVWVTMMRIALVFAAGNSLLMGLPRSIYLRFAPPNRSASKQYALSELLLAIAGLAMAMALFRAGITDSNELETDWLAPLALSSLASSVISLLLATIPWPKWLTPLLFVALVAAFVGSVAFLNVPLVPGITRFLGTGWEYVLDALYIATTFLVATLPMYLMRRQGWRWTRVTATADETALLQADSAVA